MKPHQHKETLCIYGCSIYTSLSMQFEPGIYFGVFNLTWLGLEE